MDSLYFKWGHHKLDTINSVSPRVTVVNMCKCNLLSRLQNALCTDVYQLEDNYAHLDLIKRIII